MATVPSPPTGRGLVRGAPREDAEPVDHPTVRALRDRFPEAVERARYDAVRTPVVVVDPGSAFEALQFLRDDEDQAYDLLLDVTAADLGGGRPIQVWYQLWSMEHGRMLRIVFELPRDELALPSVTSLWQTADWLEREVYDMFGVTFHGHPDLRRILMPENYEEGFPLRKDFPLRGRFSRSEQTRRALTRGLEDTYARDELERAGRFYGDEEEIEEVPSGMSPEEVGELAEDLEGKPMLINIGPQHPATHGVLRLVLELDGERVRECTPHIGYLHTGFEKTCEYREWNQVVPYTDRMDYLAPMIYNIAYAGAVESLLDVQITPRCRVLRVILNELNRILGHLLWLGTTSLDLGAMSVFLYTFQERERIYNLHEAYCGGRITTSVTRVGGMVADLPAGWIDGLREFLDTFPKTLEDVENLLTTNSIWQARTQGVGQMDADRAVQYGLTGPNLRASGVPYDVRKARPYLGYDEYDFDVPVGEHGDAYDRYLVRLEEMRQSARILEQALERLPEGPINVDDPRVVLPDKHDAMGSIDSMISHFKLVMEGLKVPPGDVWYSVEASKGELGIGLVSDGGEKPVRCRFRAPSFVNISALPEMVEDGLVADVIAVNASLDIVLGEIDR